MNNWKWLALGGFLIASGPSTIQAQPGAVASKFKEIDTNGDGKISPEEFKKFPLLAIQFKGADKNGDGLTLEEVRSHMAAVAQKSRTSAPPSASDVPLKEGPKVLSPAHAGIGRMVPDFPLETITGQKRTLSELAAKNGLIIAFTSPSCPICKKYGPSLGELDKAQKDLGIQILYVNPTATDKPAEIQSFIETNQLKGPYVHDKQGAISKALGASTTAEVFLLDSKRTVIYRGALDDQYGLGYSLNAPRRTFLKDALDSLLAHRHPNPAATTAPGCSLDSGENQGATTPNTYHERISRIIDSHCVECHRSGGVAPFSLETPEDLASHGAMIAKVVEKGTMPPWFANPTSETQPTPWANDRSLPNQDKKDLLSWLKSDRPRGDAKNAPLPRTFKDGWLIGKPDLILAMDKPMAVKATGTMDYQNVTIETRLKEDKWVRAIEIHPGAPEVVHHVLVFVLPPGRDEEGEDAPEVGSEERMGFFGLYVPGNSVISYPVGYGKKIPKGSRLRFQMHYTPNGKATTDLTKIGLLFADKTPQYEVKTVGIVNTRFRIPPGADNHPEEATLRVPSTSTILGFFPHMHLRGKAFRFELTPLDGKTETILDIPAYDFNWQLFYRLAEPRTLATGTVIKAKGWFDNSAKNPANPDPTKVVQWGPQTSDEMMLGYVEYIVPVVQPKR